MDDSDQPIAQPNKNNSKIKNSHLYGLVGFAGLFGIYGWKNKDSKPRFIPIFFIIPITTALTSLYLLDRKK
ncbi:unnamed protein product [Brachionus calyciflorus]|uniref:Uncharacterized protein n=1 Tax=Brachionus calyciflorus TaxID=104777 RepID=A0A813ZD42_9BILA|nr:unnamed protein product [Brachionus calyciflorus]